MKYFVPQTEKGPEEIFTEIKNIEIYTYAHKYTFT